MLHLLALLITPPAAAGTVLSWDETFDAYEDPTFSGTGGWFGVYSGDPWTTQGIGGVAPVTNTTMGVLGWGFDSPTDNHLIRVDHLEGDFELVADVVSTDDDAVGVTFRFQDEANFYVAFVTRNAAPGLGTAIPVDTIGARIYKVEAGNATLIDGNVGLPFTYTIGVWTTIRLVAQGQWLELWLDVDGDGLFGVGERVAAGADTTWSSGYVGLYSYSNAAEFDDVRLYHFDADDDGLANHADNCAEIANVDQLDLDGDDIGDACDHDDDGDGIDDVIDCDDLDAAVGAPDVWYDDADGDGFGAGIGAPDCAQPVGSVLVAGDCDDLDAYRHPDMPEYCNGVDDDCDVAVDEAAVNAPAWYVDGDGDGHGTTASPALFTCAQPVGYAALGDDCDDDNAWIAPSADELCNGVDDDCDQVVDEADAVDAATWYADLDEDGFGDAATAEPACDAPAGFVADDTDCDDDRADAFPGAPEVCNALDDDCDAAVDEDLPTSSWYSDADADGFGDPETEVLACEAPPGLVADGTDCDDHDDDVFPGADEVAGNDVDEDCDGADLPAPDDDPDDGDHDHDDVPGGGDDTAGGCGCDHAPTGASAAWVLLLGLVAGRRRRGYARAV